jgi:peptidoglycan/LPS O-acetylase OafA/YrhL
MTGTKEIYFDQLNGIRFIAVFMVLLDHWLIPINPFSFLGHLGVVLFFVLSGFLITRILFQSADDCRANQSGAFAKIVRFIYRRSLRIFPIYFLILLLGFIFSLSNFRNVWPYLVFYLPNFYIMSKGTWLGIWDHLWSLAVEEQYYLFFPYFVLFLNPKRYKALFVGMIIVGIGTRLAFFLLASNEVKESNWMWWYVNPFAAIDCFGIGGILAYLFHYKHTFFQTLKYLKLGLLTSLLAFIAVLILAKNSEFSHNNLWTIIFERLMGACIAFFMIGLSIQRDSWFLTPFLRYKFVAYLGQISYGIYLYHNLVMNYYHDAGNTIWFYINSYLPDFHLELVNFTLFRFLICLVILISLSSLSWYLIEKPINKYKNRI